MAKIAARMRAWRLKNAVHYRAWRELHRDKIRARRVEIRKQAAGRVCDDCGRSDSEAAWRDRTHQCGACQVRERRNGRCGCGAILVREMTVSGPASKGTQGERVCPDRCSERPRVSAVDLALWDALRWRDDERLTADRLAELLGKSKRTVERQKEAILESVRKHDPDARWDVDRELPGWPAVLVVRLRLLVSGLERLMIGGAA